MEMPQVGATVWFEKHGGGMAAGIVESVQGAAWPRAMVRPFSTTPGERLGPAEPMSLGSLYLTLGAAWAAADLACKRWEISRDILLLQMRDETPAAQEAGELPAGGAG